MNDCEKLVCSGAGDVTMAAAEQSSVDRQPPPISTPSLRKQLSEEGRRLLANSLNYGETLEPLVTAAPPRSHARKKEIPPSPPPAERLPVPNLPELAVGNVVSAAFGKPVWRYTGPPENTWTDESKTYLAVVELLRKDGTVKLRWVSDEQTLKPTSQVTARAPVSCIRELRGECLVNDHESGHYVMMEVEEDMIDLAEAFNTGPCFPPDTEYDY